jgi:hypothetical protein
MANTITRNVDVILTVNVRGQLTNGGDVRDLEPIVQAIVNGASAGFLQWTKDGEDGRHRALWV